MWKLGIDIAKHKHNATLLDEQGKIVFRNLSFNNSNDGVEKLLDHIEKTGHSIKGITVVMEATGHYWMLLYHHLVELGFDVKLVNPIVTKARRNMAVRGSKTDSADSLMLAKLLFEQDIKISAVPYENQDKLRNLTRLRFECCKQTIAEKLKLIALLDVVFPEYKKLFSDVFSRSSLELLKQFPTAEQLAKIDIRKLTALLKKASNGQLGNTKTKLIKNVARTSFALNCGKQILSLEIRMVVERLNLILDHIKELEKLIAAIMIDEQQLLKTLPGVGDVWAPTILAEVLPVFHPDRKDGAALVAIAGLDPKLRESGKSIGKARMSKRGSKYLRTAVMEAANVAANVSKDPMFRAIYEKQMNRGKHHKVALSHVAHKMLHVIFSMLKNKKQYEPNLTTGEKEKTK